MHRHWVIAVLLLSTLFVLHKMEDRPTPVRTYEFGTESVHHPVPETTTVMPQGHIMGMSTAAVPNQQ